LGQVGVKKKQGNQPGKVVVLFGAKSTQTADMLESI